MLKQKRKGYPTIVSLLNSNTTEIKPRPRITHIRAVSKRINKMNNRINPECLPRTSDPEDKPKENLNFNLYGRTNHTPTEFHSRARTPPL
jgi:hypothetical protein